ncbi:jg17290 [Pararge aegeria aegeria]|uniref:Jg17290 protein n=1 Tax=Pararge aegeria aegeria TaxID=348720 RepID=A0A8S4R5R4_9NEOP|nr:jg17290 [Pararge aegeria aegeria]
MTLKVLILICLAFSMGNAQENSEPNLTYDERFVHLGPSSIHSIKGKFYEERQRKIISKPVLNYDIQSQKLLTNISKPEQQRSNERIIFRRNEDSENKNSRDDIKEPKLKAYNTSNVSKLNIKKDVSKNLPETQEYNSDSTLLGSVEPTLILSLKEPLNSNFHAENSVSSYDKNNTIETIKKELAFDSLLIRNDFNNMSRNQAPRNIMSSYMSEEINPETVVFDNPESRIELQGEEPSRRSETNAYNEPNQRLGTGANNEPRPNDPFQIPRAENIIPITRNFDDNDDNNLLNNINSPTTVPLRQTNYNVIDKHTCDDKESDETMGRSGNNIQLQDPTKGFGISNVGKSRVMLLDHPRVCYACSSINDPSCWSPDRKTAVKYCRTDHLSCLTKLYKYKGNSLKICSDIKDAIIMRQLEILQIANHK